jgi:hypothetical protein
LLPVKGAYPQGCGGKSTTKSENKHMKIHKYVGLDVHKEKTTVAIAEGEVRPILRGRAGMALTSDLLT